MLPCETISRVGCGVLVLWAAAGIAAGQEDYLTLADDTTITIPKLSPEELEELLAPIALYPDALLAQILAASTYPADVVLANRWVQEKRDPATLDERDWDPSIKALTQFPTVLKMMDEQLEWTSQLGEAYLNQPEDVMAAVQSLRAKARAAGSLSDTPEQRIVVEERVIQIVPANPEIIYVPVYSPQVVYVPSATPPPVPVRFGLGIRLGAWANLGCDWIRRCVYYDRWRGPGYVYRTRTDGHRESVHVTPPPSASYRGASPGWEGQRWSRDGRRGPPPRGGTWISQVRRGEGYRGHDKPPSGTPILVRPGAGITPAVTRRDDDDRKPRSVFNPPQHAGEVDRFSGRGQSSREGMRGRTGSGASGQQPQRDRQSPSVTAGGSSAVHSPPPLTGVGSTVRTPQTPSVITPPPVQRTRDASVRTPQTPRTVSPLQAVRNLGAAIRTQSTPSAFSTRQSGSEVRSFSTRGLSSRGGTGQTNSGSRSDAGSQGGSSGLRSVTGSKGPSGGSQGAAAAPSGGGTRGGGLRGGSGGQGGRGSEGSSAPRR